MFDKFGRAAVAQDGVGADPIEAMLQMFSTLFGGDRFEDYFGEVALIKVMRIQFDPNTRLQMPSDPEAQDKWLQEQMAEASRQRREKLVHKLLIKLEPYVCGEVQSWKDHVRFPERLS